MKGDLVVLCAALPYMLHHVVDGSAEFLIQHVEQDTTRMVIVHHLNHWLIVRSIYQP